MRAPRTLEQDRPSLHEGGTTRVPSARVVRAARTGARGSPGEDRSAVAWPPGPVVVAPPELPIVAYARALDLPELPPELEAEPSLDEGAPTERNGARLELPELEPER